MALREIWDGWIGRINLARSRANTQVGGPKFPLDLQRGNFNTEDWPCDTVLRGQEKGEGRGKVPEAPEVCGKGFGGCSLVKLMDGDHGT